MLFTHHIRQCDLGLWNNQSNIKSSFDSWFIPAWETTSGVSSLKLSDPRIAFLSIRTASTQRKIVINIWLTMFESATNLLESSKMLILKVAFNLGSSQHGNMRRACVVQSCVTAEYEVTGSFPSSDSLYPNHQQ